MVVTRRAFAPGRVNLIGDHTDYTGGLAVPMAVQLGTTVTVDLDDGPSLRVRSDSDPSPVTLSLPVADPRGQRPAWGRYVAAVVAEMGGAPGGRGFVRTTLPVGAGLASSAALEVAFALALGFRGTSVELARLCQRAEHAAVGVPCGIMDQLASAQGQEGCALLLDCASATTTAVPIPHDVEIVAVHSGQPRMLAGSAYAERRSSCERAETLIGPLRHRTLGDLAAIPDGRTRRRARHVITENARSARFAAALSEGRLDEAGRLMAESHRSLRDDFEVVTPPLEAVVSRLAQTPGVWGARMTGAGFGGCAVALCRPGAVQEGWRLRPVGPACVG